MSKKLFIIMTIIALSVAIVPIVIVIFYDESNITTNSSSSTSVLSPLNLTLNTEEVNQNEVTITASSNSSDSSIIITLPDNSKVNSTTATYTVKENGKYEFTVSNSSGNSQTSEITVSNIAIISSSNPYIPAGFTYSTGEPNNGYTIIDDFSNEYVWIPVSDGKLIRDTADNKDYEETDVTVTELMNSVEKYYGFYIAKYEASMYTTSGTSVAATIQNKKPWTSIVYSTAEKSSLNSASVFGYSDSKTAIMNSYAWDTALNWINSTVENYSSNTSFGNYSGDINLTGSTVTDTINHICDMAGNVSEWTTEKYIGNTESTVYRVTRGGYANLSRTARSHRYNDEIVPDSSIGFRMVLYKTVDK